jgi:hypothetical protein
MSRILLAITSCKKDALAGYNQAQRDTFLKSASRFPNVIYRFFIGDGTPTHEDEAAVRASVGGCFDLNRSIDYQSKCDESERSTPAWEYTNLKYDEVFLPVPDDYFHLVYKVRAIYRWALQFGFTHIFKCDTDTYVDIDRLMRSGFEKHDFTGGPAGSTSVAGGSGYWISRQSAQILADAPVTYWAEDGWVNGTLGKYGIFLFTDYRYSDNLVSDNNDLVSTHLGFRPGYTIAMMYRAHRARINVIAGVR